MINSNFIMKVFPYCDCMDRFDPVWQFLYRFNPIVIIDAYKGK